MKRLDVLDVLAVLPLLSGCSASGFRDWAAGVQLNASTSLYQKTAERELNAWQWAGESGAIYNPRAQATAASAEAKASADAAKTSSAPATPTSPPVIYFVPTQ